MATKTKAQVEAELAALQAEHEALKTRVRNRVVQAMKDGEICQSGGAQALHEFGLEAPKTTGSGYISLNIYLTNVPGEIDRWGEWAPDDNLVYDVVGDIEVSLNNMTWPGDINFDRFEHDDTAIYPDED